MIQTLERGRDKHVAPKADLTSRAIGVESRPHTRTCEGPRRQWKNANKPAKRSRGHETWWRRWRRHRRL